MTPIDLQVTIEPKFPAILPDAITFECGTTRAEVSDPETFAYNHHGPEFGQRDPGALTAFFEDLILGRPFPLKFATHAVRGVDTLVAIALFLQRDLAIAPATPGLVAAVDLVHRFGYPMTGHLDRDLGGFLRFLWQLIPDNLSQKELGKRVEFAVDRIRSYLLEGVLPSVNLSWPEVQILDKGTNGFVLARTLGSMADGWVELFRLGCLRGVLLQSKATDGRYVVSLARKSAWVAFDLERAQDVLNGLEEAAMGEPAWHLNGDLLFGPLAGSVIRPLDLLQLAIRI